MPATELIVLRGSWDILVAGSGRTVPSSGTWKAWWLASSAAGWAGTCQDWIQFRHFIRDFLQTGLFCAQCPGAATGPIWRRTLGGA